MEIIKDIFFFLFDIWSFLVFFLPAVIAGIFFIVTGIKEKRIGMFLLGIVAIIFSLGLFVISGR